MPHIAFKRVATLLCTGVFALLFVFASVFVLTPQRTYASPASCGKSIPLLVATPSGSYVTGGQVTLTCTASGDYVTVVSYITTYNIAAFFEISNGNYPGYQAAAGVTSISSSTVVGGRSYAACGAVNGAIYYNGSLVSTGGKSCLP